MIKARYVFPALALIAPFSLAGCGEEGSGADPASLAPPDTPVFVAATIQPTGDLRADVERIAARLGVDDLGGTIVSYLERSAGDSDRPIDFKSDVEPWLGEAAGIFLTEFDGDEFAGGGLAVEAGDAAKAQAFLDDQAESATPEPEDASYEGIDYRVDPDGEDAVGIVGDFVVFGQDRRSFEAAVDASEGESLADVEAYETVLPSSPEGSLADVYVDIGGLIEAAGSGVDPDAKNILGAAGVEIEESAALVSLVPGADSLEVDLFSELGEAEGALAGPAAAELLGTMPAGALAAISAGDFGERVGTLLDTLDESGIPGEVPPGQFKSTLKRAGIDVDRIAAGLGDAAVFAAGVGGDLGGALVIEAKNPTEARNTVSNIGTLLRASGVDGVTAVSGRASGFSIRDEGLGDRPLVVAAEGGRIAVGYGLSATLDGLTSESGPSLSETRTYDEALDALGETPIVGFAAGGPALRLLESLVPAGNQDDLDELRDALTKIPYLAIGAETNDDIARARLILGVSG